MTPLQNKRLRIVLDDIAKGMTIANACRQSNECFDDFHRLVARAGVTGHIASLTAQADALDVKADHYHSEMSRRIDGGFISDTKLASAEANTINALRRDAQRLRSKANDISMENMVGLAREGIQPSAEEEAARLKGLEQEMLAEKYYAEVMDMVDV